MFAGGRWISDSMISTGKYVIVSYCYKEVCLAPTMSRHSKTAHEDKTSSLILAKSSIPKGNNMLIITLILSTATPASVFSGCSISYLFSCYNTAVGTASCFLRRYCQTMLQGFAPISFLTATSIFFRDISIYHI